MNSDRWRRLGELFDQASDLPPDQQHTYLREACGEDRALLSELTHMLRAHAGQGVLDQPLAPLATAALRGSSAGPAAGAWVGPYQVRREIDRGGMGVVYEAHDPRLDRLVALKCLPPSLQASPLAKAQFLAEARAAAALEHPNICTVYELGDDPAGGLFIAMPFYDGQTLQARVSGSRVTIDEAVGIALQIATGLEAAHQAGVVHRDVKPSNIIVTGRGEAKLLDFGIAQFETDPQAGLRAGTPHYMSPEQVRGEASDHRTDLWSLGVVLYELVAGRRPFTGDAQGVLRAILDTPPAPLGLTRPSVPPALSDIVSRLLEKTPGERFQSATELRVALAAVQASLAGGAPSGAPRAARGRLPAVLTSFVGREREMASIDRLLRANRLVTLTGPGGTGKTRLSIEVARRFESELPDGVAFVALGAVSDPALVPSVIAEAVGALSGTSGPVVDALLAALARRHLLLVLDNFEQVVAGAALLSTLLAECPGVRALVTSRVALRVDGEHQFAVSPLPVPREGPFDQSDDGSAALQLFADRARAADPSFTLGPPTAPVVADLVRRLDGMPLAIELAAANLKLFPPQQMLARLESRFQVLGRGGRDRPSRHRSLRAAIAWSYDLLSPEEQRVFRALGTFVGGCTFASADAVCGAILGAGCAAADAVAALIEHSLLRSDAAGSGEPRFGMLESIRAFALERLEEAGEADRAHLAHAEHFLALAEAAEPEMVGPRQKDWLDTLQAEHDNLRVAIAWAERTRQTELALRFGAALWRFWLARGHLAEGRTRLDALVRQAPDAALPLRVRALNGLGTLLHSEGRIRAARDVLEGALRLCRSHEEACGAAIVLNNLAWVASELSDLDTAERLCHEALAINRALGDTRGIALALNNLGWVAMYRGEFRAARVQHAESLDLRRKIGDRRGIAFASSNVSWCDAWCGRYAEAAALLDESMAVLLDVGDTLLLGWAQVVDGVRRYLQGDLEAARDSLDRARQGWRDGGNRSVLAAALLYLGHVHAARGDLDAATATLDEGFRVYREIGTEWGVAGALHAMGCVAFTRGDHDRAKALADESLALRRRMGHRLGAAECHELLGELLRAAGDDAQARRHLEEGARIRQELGTPLPAWRGTSAYEPGTTN